MGIVVLAAALLVAGCSGDVPDGQVRVPGSSDSFDGEQAEEVVAQFEEAGFEDVQAEGLGDLITGWLNEPGEVKEVEIDGESSFSSSATFSTGVKIVVYYHSFPEEDAEESSPDETEAPAPAPTDEPLTVESSPEFASLLLLGDYCDADIAAFAETNGGRTISFDGNIGALANNSGSSTRYDILLGAGDYDENAQLGPAFQFRDVNITSDLGLTGSNIPDSLAIGDNIRVTAIVDSYEENSCLLLLDPVSTEYR